jgi:hypothetical protein
LTGVSRASWAAIAALLVFACGLAGASARAACPTLPARHLAPKDARAFAATIEDALAASGAKVAIVFRVGLPPGDMPKDMLFSHGGLWVRVDGAEPDYQTFNLYQGDGRRLRCDRSELVQDTPEGFFTGTVTPPQAAVLIPTAEMQRRLLALLNAPAYAALHNPDYSLMANPFERKHQNCTDFLLRLVVAARLDITNADRIDATIRREFKPTDVKLNPLVRTFGSVIDSRLVLDDQHGAIETATFASLADYMRAKGLLAEAPSYVQLPVAAQWCCRPVQQPAGFP